MGNVCKFYDHLEDLTAIWYNLWPFGMVCGHLVYFSRFGMFVPRKIWQPCSSADLRVGHTTHAKGKNSISVRKV
jgi:hypothetical protein